MRVSILKKGNLSDEISTALQQKIYHGALAAGQRINEIHLSEELGVSRTPLREALQRLVAIDVLDSIPRRGFFVRPLTIKEFSDIYPMRGILDPAALQWAGMPDRGQIEVLKALNSALLLEDDPTTAIQIDDSWHMTLLEHCTNAVIIETIRHFIQRSLRYELAYFTECGGKYNAGMEHAEIIDALENNNLHAACELLRKNLTTGTEPILTWLRERGYHCQRR